MKNVLLSLAAASFLVSVASAEIAGGTSNATLVEVGKSSSLPFGSGMPGIAMNGSGTYVNLQNGPVRVVKGLYNGNPMVTGTDELVDPQGKYIKPSDINPLVGWFSSKKIGETWFERRTSGTKDFDVISVRQIGLPLVGEILASGLKFGGLVIGDASVDNTAVFFGEWSPRPSGDRPEHSVDLNMNTADRTVWFVGNNALDEMPQNFNAEYDVLGVHKHVPGKNDFYRGTLTASFGTTTGTLTGTLSKTGATIIDFAGTTISDDAKFKNGAKGIEGQFYGPNAEALAGIYTGAVGSGAGDDVAFGGKKK